MPAMSGKFCYVVLAHTDPDGMLRLVRRIRDLSPDADVVVRYDDPDYIDPTRIRAATAIPYLSRVRVGWGDWSQVEMVLGAFAFARGVSDADWFCNISGQDYPVRDLLAWERRVRDSGADAILDPLPTHRADYEFAWAVRTLPATGRDLVDRGLHFAVNRVGHAIRPVAHVHTTDRPGDRRVWFGLTRSVTPGEAPMPVTKASEWLTLDRAALDTVLRRDRHDAATRNFFRRVKIPDESYVPSLLHDTAGLKVVHGETTGKHFRDGAPNPTWIDADELAFLRRSSAAPFVRKIPADVDTAVLAEADVMCARPVEQIRDEVVLPGRETDASRWKGEVRANVTDEVFI